jgi:hypothetical protein
MYRLFYLTGWELSSFRQSASATHARASTTKHTMTTMTLQHVHRLLFDGLSINFWPCFGHFVPSFFFCFEATDTHADQPAAAALQSVTSWVSCLMDGNTMREGRSEGESIRSHHIIITSHHYHTD